MPSMHMRRVLVVALGVATSASGQDYTAYYNYLGRFPAGETDWSDDAQGVAHDDDNWFITRTLELWKIPVERNLNSVSVGDPGVIRRRLDSYDQLAGYHHLGDPDVFQYDATHAYLVLPIEHENVAEPGALAILRCSDLSYVDHVELVNADGEPYQAHDAGWFAVNRQGLIFSSVQHPGLGGGPSLLLGYALDWDRLHVQNQAVLTLQEVHAMHDELGNPLDLVTMQGGEFGPEGTLLYLISGFHNDDDQRRHREGIHVLAMDGPFSWQRVAHSTNGTGYFNYFYNSDFTVRNEPEGLTIWDLDDGRAPGIRGQLHAFMSDNDLDAGDIYFYHYTHVIRVDPGASCGLPLCCGLPAAHPSSCAISGARCEPGTPLCPFATVGDAAGVAWDGSEIRMQSGIYDEAVSITNRVRLVAEGGPARIGG